MRVLLGAVVLLLGCGRSELLPGPPELLGLTHHSDSLRLDSLSEGVVTRLATLPRRDGGVYHLSVDITGQWALVNRWEPEGNVLRAADVMLVDLGSGNHTSLALASTSFPWRWRTDAPGLLSFSGGRTTAIDFPSLASRVVGETDCGVDQGTKETGLVRCGQGVASATTLVTFATGAVSPGPTLSEADRVIGLQGDDVSISRERDDGVTLLVLSPAGEERSRRQLSGENILVQTLTPRLAQVTLTSNGERQSFLWDAQTDTQGAVSSCTAPGIDGRVSAASLDGRLQARISCDASRFEVVSGAGALMDTAQTHLPYLSRLTFDLSADRVLIQSATRLTATSLEPLEYELFDVLNRKSLGDPRVPPLDEGSALIWRHRTP